MHGSAILAAALLGSAANAAPRLLARQSNSTAFNMELIHKLELAATAAERVNMLSDSDFIFDFRAPPPNSTITGEGGHAVAANRENFPALIGTGVAMTLGFLGPCGFNTPHIHPRATEINVVVQGRLATTFVTENGVDPIGPNFLDTFQMTVFPQGATHTEFNPDCGHTIFVAGFNSEDPGTQQTAQTFFELLPAIVEADLGVETLNGESITEFEDKLPVNVALGVHSCLKKCGIPIQTPNQTGAQSASASASPSTYASTTAATSAATSASSSPSGYPSKYHHDGQPI